MTHIELPAQIWGRLASVADDRGVTVQDLLVAGIEQIIKPRDRRERVLHYVRAGYTDARTAEATGELKQYVGQIRRKAGIPRNRQYRTETEGKK